jgi:hypothetical protein
MCDVCRVTCELRRPGCQTHKGMRRESADTESKIAEMRKDDIVEMKPEVVLILGVKGLILRCPIVIRD